MKMLSIKQGAELLNISRWTFVGLLESGQIPAVIVKSGRRKRIWRIREDALQEWITAKEAETKKVTNGARRLKAI
jgi:excisionase family DNA binding protein